MKCVKNLKAVSRWVHAPLLFSLTRCHLHHHSRASKVCIVGWSYPIFTFVKWVQLYTRVYMLFSIRTLLSKFSLRFVGLRPVCFAASTTLCSSTKVECWLKPVLNGWLFCECRARELDGVYTKPQVNAQALSIYDPWLARARIRPSYH